jgi:hypothetical protein
VYFDFLIQRESPANKNKINAVANTQQNYFRAVNKDRECQGSSGNSELNNEIPTLRMEADI